MYHPFRLSAGLAVGRAGPSVFYPCRCLCFGSRLQITLTTPRRRTILQCSQIRFTLERTFMTNPSF
jgi:hypothetical protein